MDELRGPNIQIVLHVKEGLGFGFLKAPFVVSGSLNGYILETDPAVPVHAPVFDAELVWEADKRRFRNLRVQNVPIKIEVFTMGTQGKKDKIGYLLLSLLGAQPCPTNKIIEVKHAWHRLLGVKSEGKCCHPQLLLSLCIQDRISIPTPRNEHRMFHSNEAAYISTAPSNPVTTRSFQNTFSEYVAASKKTVSNPELQPRLLSNEGLIEIGTGKHLFVLSFVIGSIENVDLLIPNYDPWSKDVGDCHIKYCIFTQEITTDRVAVSKSGGGCVAHLNQRTSVRLRTSLCALSGYLAECPHLVVSLCCRDTHAGICCIDLRKIIPTDSLKEFLTSFCNTPRSLTIHERCFLTMSEDRSGRKERNCYMDIEISLKYIDADNKPVRANPLFAQSVTQLQSGFPKDGAIETPIGLPYKGSSLTDIEPNVCDAAYTNITASNTNRYRNVAGDNCLPTSEIAELIKKMCESLTQSQERILSARVNIREEIRVNVNVRDAEVQWEPSLKDTLLEEMVAEKDVQVEQDVGLQSAPQENEQDRGDANVNKMDEKDKVKIAISPEEREAILKQFVDELEEWKEKQQQLYKIQLERKEQYHLEVLAKEWAKRRVELECKLSRGIEQCRTLATELSKATDDFRLRGYRNMEREKKLAEAKKALEQHYTAKYQELREASVKMEQDWQHQLRLKDMRIEELETTIQQLERQSESLKNTMAAREKEAETKYSGLTKDQTASLIQELRCLEEKLDNAVQSKAFFKEQWGRAVRELHLMKLNNRKQMLMQLKSDRKQLQDMGLEPPLADEGEPRFASEVDLEKMKDDYYVNILVNSPNLDSGGYINADCGPECMEMYKELLTPKRRLNDKLSDLINRREKLIQEDNPDEEVLRQLNQEIRSMLLNCNT